MALSSRQSMLRSVISLSNFLKLPASHFALGAPWKVGQTGVIFLPLSLQASTLKGQWAEVTSQLARDTYAYRLFIQYITMYKWQDGWLLGALLLKSSSFEAALLGAESLRLGLRDGAWKSRLRLHTCLTTRNSSLEALCLHS